MSPGKTVSSSSSTAPAAINVITTPMARSVFGTVGAASGISPTTFQRNLLRAIPRHEARFVGGEISPTLSCNDFAVDANIVREHFETILQAVARNRAIAHIFFVSE